MNKNSLILFLSPFHRHLQYQAFKTSSFSFLIKHSPKSLYFQSVSQSLLLPLPQAHEKKMSSMNMMIDRKENQLLSPTKDTLNHTEGVKAEAILVTPENNSNKQANSKNSSSRIRIAVKRRRSPRNHPVSSLDYSCKEFDGDLKTTETTTKKPKVKKSPLQSTRKNQSSLTSSTTIATATTSYYSSDVAQISPDSKWIDLKIPPSELRPSATLTTGQCFNWSVVKQQEQKHSHSNEEEKEKKESAWGTHNEIEWIGPLDNYVFLIKETPQTTLYRVLYNGHNADESTISEYLRDYFQVSSDKHPKLSDLYTYWSQKDTSKRMLKIAPYIPGLRVVRQNPLECLMSFICSSNNNIPRITKMLQSLRHLYGTHLTHGIYSFPTLQDLMKVAGEKELREIGFGYRARYIIETRDLLLKKGGEEYLLGLREKEYKDVIEELTQFCGIGRKVADCIALFSLDQTNAIPVDVHVQHIASRDFANDYNSIFGSGNSSPKSMTPSLYNAIVKLFQDRFTYYIKVEGEGSIKDSSGSEKKMKEGRYSGWAHSLLFVAELPSFRHVLPDDIVQQNDLWKEMEKQKKKKNVGKK